MNLKSLKWLVACFDPVLLLNTSLKCVYMHYKGLHASFRVLFWLHVMNPIIFIMGNAIGDEQLGVLYAMDLTSMSAHKGR